MLALTLYPEFAKAICCDGKDVENRTWRSERVIGQRLAIHSSMKETDLNFPIGAIVATATVVDIVRDSTSHWAMPGYWHWLLGDICLLDPIYCKGKQGLWLIDDFEIACEAKKIDYKIQLTLPFCFSPFGH